MSNRASSSSSSRRSSRNSRCPSLPQPPLPRSARSDHLPPRRAHDKPPEGCRIKLLSIAIQDYEKSPPNTFGPLKTPRRDQHRVALFARRLGATDDNIHLMRENSTNRLLLPTWDNILAQIAWLVQDAKLGDFLIFHYSGHGHQVRTRSLTEPDGLDEAIVTMDEPDPNPKSRKHLISDNLLRARLVDPLKTGVCLMAIMDACMSGTMLDLDSSRKRKHQRRPLPLGGRSMSLFYPPSWLFKSVALGAEAPTPKRMRSEQGSLPRKRSSHGPGVVGTPTEERKMFFTEMGGIKRSASPEPIADEGEERPDVICFSACRDNQKSWSKGERTFTHYVIGLLEKHLRNPITPTQYNDKLTQELHRALAESLGLQVTERPVRETMRGVQAAQVTTLAGYDDLLQKPFCIPCRISGPQSGRKISHPR